MMRNENAVADKLAKDARDGAVVAQWKKCANLERAKFLVSSDGSCAHGRAGAGAAVFLYSGGQPAVLCAMASVQLLGGISSVDAEFEAIILGLLLFTDFLRLHSEPLERCEGRLHVL
jgi:hypothetical protein